MQISVSFRQLDPSAALENLASEKLERVIKKYITGQDIDASIVFSIERRLHVANFTITINGLKIKGVDKSDNMYNSIDKALEKVERQIRRYKDKIRDHKPSASRPRSFTMNVLAVEDYDEDYEYTGEHEAAEAPAPAAAAQEAPLLVKSETYIAPSLSVKDAIMQLNMIDSDFFVFTNSANEHLSIVYKRADGRYSIIEPEAA